MISNAEVRAGKKFLKSKGLDEHIPARKFAMAAKELDTSYKNTLQYLANGEENGKDTE